MCFSLVFVTTLVLVIIIVVIALDINNLLRGLVEEATREVIDPLPYGLAKVSNARPDEPGRTYT